jgi:diguanylate cyclase (GGDEF)-like protein
MTLTRQLWILLTLIALLAFGGAFTLSMFSARDYMADQLRLKNQDNAASFALALSQLDKDAAILELLVSAQFDSGHYQSIILRDFDGNLLVARENPALKIPGPQWLPELFPMNVEPAVAEIQDGWNPFARLTLQSDSSFAYLSLWQETRRLAFWFALGLLLCGGLSSWLLRRIISPLDAVVGQAEAIGERRFIEIAQPKTREFSRLVLAMNALSKRVQSLLSDETERLEEFRRKSHYDPLTGLLQRQPFMNQLDALLSHEDESASGALVFGRFIGLEKLNRTLGREVVDQLLRRIGENLRRFVEDRDGWSVARLGGSDFALLVSGNEDVLTLANSFSEQLHLAGDVKNTGREQIFPVGATTFAPGEDLSALLSRVDGALISAEREGGMRIKTVDPSLNALPMTDLGSWETALRRALQPGGVKLTNYPVLGRDGELLYEECPVRVMLDDEWQTAAVIMPWVAKLGLMVQMDRLVVEKALIRLRDGAGGVGIHLSAEAMCDSGFLDGLTTALQRSAAEIKGCLWIQVPETAVFRHMEQFRLLCAALKPFECRIGIEHVGNHLKRIGELHDLGIDFIKIDASLIRDVDRQTGNQALVRGLCTIAHTIGLKVIAEGVRSAGEKEFVPQLGLDGMTGPGVGSEN